MSGNSPHAYTKVENLGKIRPAQLRCTNAEATAGGPTKNQLRSLQSQPRETTI